MGWPSFGSGGSKIQVFGSTGSGNFSNRRTYSHTRPLCFLLLVLVLVRND